MTSYSDAELMNYLIEKGCDISQFIDESGRMDFDKARQFVWMDTYQKVLDNHYYSISYN